MFRFHVLNYYIELKCKLSDNTCLQNVKDLSVIIQGSRVEMISYKIFKIFYNKSSISPFQSSSFSLPLFSLDYKF